VVNRRVALLVAFFILVATAIEAAGLLNEFAPLVLLGNGSDTSALPAAQLQALTSLQGRLSDFHYTLYTVFFGLDILCLSYLVYRAGPPAKSHRRPAGRRRRGLPGLQLHLLSSTELGCPPDPLDPTAPASG
jgi:uncharacterized membrane protein